MDLTPGSTSKSVTHLWEMRIKMMGSSMAQQGDSIVGLVLELMKKMTVFPLGLIHW